MLKKIRYITEAAVLLALLVALQAVTKPLGQLVTGSCVNAVLAVAALLCGWSSGLTVALVSPVCAYLFGIAPQILTVPVIMVGNAVYVVILCIVGNQTFWKRVTGLLGAALCKFALLYVLVTYGICGILADTLTAQGLLKPAMLKALPATFSAPQLVTALVGGTLAMLLVPVLKKALKRT